MKSARDHIQTVQRLKVGLIGLAAVVLLIGLASAIIGSTTRTPPAGISGDPVANMALTNEAGQGEPLAELGAAPGPSNGQVAAR